MNSYNAFLEKLLLPSGDVFLKTSFMKDLRLWRRWEHLDHESVGRLCRRKLLDLLTYASISVPFYRSMIDNHQKDPEIWLQQFPVMYKSDINDHIHEMINGNREKLVCETSSGSSGIQGAVYMTRKEQYSAIATQTFLWEWSGYKLGNNILQLGMTTNRGWLKKCKDILLRTEYQQAFKINNEEACQALERFVSIPGFMGGYASGLYAYACMAEELNIKPHFISVISWGDKMFPHFREKIEEQFNTKVFDTYGATEGFIIAGQCEFGNYHILTPNVYLELLDKDGVEVAPGELGYVVVTRLDAYAMPLIRYYLGDLAIKMDTKEKCMCGKPFPMLEKIVGRDTDIVRTKSGKYLIVHFFTGIFEHIKEIEQFRVIQNNLDGIIIEYIPRIIFYNQILNNIKIQIQQYIQEPFNIDFIKVEHIPDTPSGKPQIIVSNLAKY